MVVLDKKYTAGDSLPAIVAAIKKLARDKSERVLKDDHIEWLETKLREIARLAAIAKRKAR